MILDNSSDRNSILVLSDGKPGHYNQSLGIVDRMRDVSVRTIEVRFKGKWRDDLLRVWTRLLVNIRPSRDVIKALLVWAVEDFSATTALNSGSFDAILSTGSSLSAPNLLLGRLTGAKTAVCMRPSPMGSDHFDLVILPEHMRPRRPRGNEVMTFGVPTRITPELAREAGTDLARRLNMAGERVVGLLLGGDDQHYSIPPDMASLLCDVLLDVCEKSGMRLAVTTSRRTDPKSEDVVKSKMRGNSSCCFLVLAGQPQRGNPVPGILGLSDVTVVTEDSFAMVCEAASSGRKVVILEVRRRRQGDPKRERIYRVLAERGYARRADISNLSDVVLGFAGEAFSPRVLDDAQIAADALRDLIRGC